MNAKTPKAIWIPTIQIQSDSEHRYCARIEVVSENTSKTKMDKCSYQMSLICIQYPINVSVWQSPKSKCIFWQKSIENSMKRNALNIAIGLQNEKSVRSIHKYYILHWWCDDGRCMLDGEAMVLLHHNYLSRVLSLAWGLNVLTIFIPS